MSFPILNRGGTYGPYLAEICRSEGLPGDLLDLDSVELAAVLADAPVVLLARCPVYRAEAELLRDYVRDGGGLVLIRPSRLLAGYFGFTPADRHVLPAYVQVSDADRMQTHVAADLYDGLPDGATVAAKLVGEEGPAITEIGRMIAFHYDVAAAITRLRQGDPARAGSRAHGVLPYRQMDLLNEDVDRSCWHQPQADIHGRLLANAVVRAASRPVPRWWYYPDPAMRSLVIQDSDDDWSTREQFEKILESVEEFGFHDTFYLMMGDRPGVLTPADVVELRKRGHSFGIHHDALGDWADGEDQELVIERIVRDDVATFQQQHGFRPLVNRNHCMVWKGYADLAYVLADVGVRMELNTHGMGDVWLNFLHGSSRPMRHVDVDGTMIDVFQQPTQVFDDVTIVDRLGGSPEIEAAAVADHLAGLIRDGHGPLSMQSHPVSFATYSAKFFRAVWKAARDLGLEIWSSEEWAAYTIARDASTISADADGWTVTAYGGSQTLMIPTEAVVRVDGEPASTTRATVHGISYQLVQVTGSADGVRHRISLS
ncbi:hypothetical protein [Fodinicola acaciae]|uniref:hypothetical protein n=1 Tax=Fodinicola acaciae TaxID=2681555 RepID=UPI0013D4F848|nr:hypothetical protein [Fodinicola acaciae]